MSEPKLIIDSDWKSQAQAEKEKLAAATAPKPGSKDAADEDRELGFEDLVGFLATQAMSYMGFIPDPYTGQAMVSLDAARLYVDLLGVLESKTKGNLSETEQTSLTKTVAQLRASFVQVNDAVAKAVAEGRIRPAQAGGAPGPAGPAGQVGFPKPG